MDERWTSIPRFHEFLWENTTSKGRLLLKDPQIAEILDVPYELLDGRMTYLRRLGRIKPKSRYILDPARFAPRRPRKSMYEPAIEDGSEFYLPLYPVDQ